MFSFNPFSKAISQLQPSDLERLRDVPESWYVEYKRQLPDQKAIAKAISAFCNTNGGWLIFGIVEANDGSRIPEAFPGLPNQDVPEAERRIRQAAVSHIQPMPSFEIQILQGPIDELGLSADHSVIVVGIPQGVHSPYVHSSGVIFTRAADSSEPSPIKDRYLLDTLWQRGQLRKQEFIKFIERKPQTSIDDQSQSAIQIFFLPDPWAERNLQSKLNFNEFSNIMKGASGFSLLKYQNIFSTADGFIARNTARNIYHRNLFYWRYYRDCSSEIYLPFSSIQVDRSTSVIPFLKGYKYALEFVDQCEKYGLNQFVLLDFNPIFSLIVSILFQLNQILNRESMNEKIYIKIKFINFWRRVPFIDISHANFFVNNFAFPIVQDSEIYLPVGSSPDDCYQIELEANLDKGSGENAFFNATGLFIYILNAVGLSLHGMGLENNEEVKKFSDEISDLFARVVEVENERAKIFG